MDIITTGDLEIFMDLMDQVSILLIMDTALDMAKVSGMVMDMATG